MFSRKFVQVRCAVVAASVTIAAALSHAEFQGRYLTPDTSHGFDAYYDTTLDVTWLADALYGGRKNWSDAESWIPTVRLGGYDDWRFPTYSNGSGNGTTGEFYQMWVVELGNNADQQHPTMTYNPGPFHNVEYYMNSGAYNPTAAYWTDYSYGDFAAAWMTFNAGYIGQYREGLSNGYGVWLVRTGDSGWAPPTGCDSIDFNNDGLFPDTQDIDDFLSVFSGGACTNDPHCGDIDFNNDGLFPDTLDIDSLLSVFSGGACF